jgi:hypothetical protein
MTVSDQQICTLRLAQNVEAPVEILTVPTLKAVWSMRYAKQFGRDFGIERMG